MLASAFHITPLTILYVMSKREKPKWQTIDHFVTKSVPNTQLPDDPDKQRTVDEDASSEESSNVALSEGIETERSSSVASCNGSSPQYPDISCLHQSKMQVKDVKMQLLTDHWKDINTFNFPARY